jgi:UDP-N-acetylglucosamine--N-acetylmuramyl-(pentapeptide) pyrophosphoryl-undecaprenol N-acetylglucosamine transferase
VLLGKPLVLHEQNSVAAWPTRCWPAWPTGLHFGFPTCSRRLGRQPAACRDRGAARTGRAFAGRSGPLRLLVVGGSLGAQVLNETVPQALA